MFSVFQAKGRSEGKNCKNCLYSVAHKTCVWRSTCAHFEAYVSVDSNWVHPPPGNPRENFFERANPGHPGKIFCLIPCPGAKNDGRIPGGGAKFSPKLEETAP